MRVLGKKMLTAFLIIAMVLGTVGTTVKAEENDYLNLLSENNLELTDITDKVDLNELRAGKYKEVENYIPAKDVISESEEVTLIIELKDEPLVEEFEVSSYKMNNAEEASFDGFVQTKEAINIDKKLDKKQDKVIDKILNLDGENAELLYQYTSIMNGFAVRTTRSAMKMIENIPGVKNVYEGTVYNHELPDMQNSKSTVGAYSSWDLGFTGKDTLIAIVDTGLDTTHDAFSIAPDSLKASKKAIQSIMNSKKLNSAITDASSTFINNKVPYAYDYEDLDTDVNPTAYSISEYSNDHGTHVAGTAAGNNGNGFTGVAPDAQLIIMKVFGDEGTGAYTEVILAALEDAMVLGADVINMSLGSSAGFSSDDGCEGVYNRITEAGVLLSVSAGNAYSMSYSNLVEGSFTNNPDTAVVGSGSTYAASTSVASVNNAGIMSGYMVIDGTTYTFDETATSGQPKFADLTLPVEIVYVPDGGIIESYDGIDVTGKIVLTQRGDISFNDKLLNAYDNGAIGIIVYNNAEGTIRMSISDYEIPAVSVTLANGEAILSSIQEGINGIDEIGFDGFEDTELGGLMSDFSSWGVTPDLKLKPEIAAPGGNIYSSVPFNAYDNMSGTSMAAPHVAGIFALIKQYINENEVFKLYSNADKAVLANQLLMSTSEPIKDERGIYYSPRQQGSGMANVYKAVTTKGYITTAKEIEQNNRPKMNLGDDPERSGEFISSFNVVNSGDEAITYDFSANVLTETLAEGSVQPVLYIGEKSQDISQYSELTYYVNGEEAASVTVPADGVVTVDVIISVNNEVKDYLNEYFENGEFIEGFVFLNTENDVDLSIPFMGFYGDWTDADIFDSGDAHNISVAQQYAGAFYSTRTNSITGSTQYLPLGVNIYDDSYELINNFDPYFYDFLYEEYGHNVTNKLAISPNGDTYFDTFDYVEYGLLRNAAELSVKITGQDGTVYLEDSYEDVRKSYYISQYDLCMPFFNDDHYNWAGTDNEGNTLPNNTVVELALEAKVDYPGAETQKISYELAIDTETPKLRTLMVFGDGVDKVIGVVAQDNQFISGIDVYDKDFNNIATIPCHEAEKNAVTVALGEIETTLTASDLIFIVNDYAENGSVYMYTQGVYDEITGIEATDITTDGFTLSWDKDDTIASYELFVLNADGEVVQRFNTTENSAVITGLEKASEYTIDIDGYYEEDGLLILDKFGNAAVKTMDEFTVTFYDFTGRVFNTQTVMEGSAAIAPAHNPTYPNYIFTKWDKDYSCVTSDMDIYPEYEVINAYYLTVNYDDGSQEITSHAAVSLVTVSAPAIEGKKFVGWKNEDDVIVNTNPVYSFYILDDTVLTAVYAYVEEEIAAAMPDITLSSIVSADFIGANPVLYYSAQVIIPEDRSNFKLLEVGTLRTKNGAAYTDDAILDINDVAAGRAKRTTHKYNSVGQFILGIKTTTGSQWDVVAYVKYIDKTTNEQVIKYSQPASMTAPAK